MNDYLEVVLGGMLFVCGMFFMAHFGPSLWRHRYVVAVLILLVILLDYIKPQLSTVVFIALVASIALLFIYIKRERVNNQNYINSQLDRLQVDWPHSQDDYTKVCLNDDLFPGKVKDINGRARHTWSDGARYSGNWQHGKFNGKGTFCYPDGSVYEGAWKAGEYNGQGTLIYSDGFRYDGKWEDGAPNGNGIATLSNDTRLMITFENGKLIFSEEI